MKRSFLALLFVAFLHSAFAGDTTVSKTDTLKYTHPAYLQFNYTMPDINNVFAEDMGALTNRITVDFDYAGNSNSIPASFAYGMIFKTPITQKLIDRSDKNIKKDFKFEDNMNTGFNYRHYFKKWDGAVTVGWHHREMRDINGPKDAFETVFYGNARFENDTANFSNFHFQNFMYNQLSVGFSKQIDYGKYQMQFGASASFLQCFNNQYIKTGNNTWLYTAPDGEYLGINYDLTFNTAKEGAVKFFQMNGAGASADIHLSFSNKNSWKVSFDIADIGYMTFRKNPVNYTGAKYVEFHGIVIPDLLSFSSQTFDTLNLDSAVRSNLPGRSTNSYSVFMPFTAHLIFSKSLLHQHMVLSVGLQYRHMPGYYMYGYVKMNYFLKHNMVVSASVGSGAFNLCNIGLEFSKVWKHFDFTLGSSNLIGLFVPSYYPGAAIYLRLGTSF